MIRRCPKLEGAAKVCCRLLSANQEKGRLNSRFQTAFIRL
nr:MAG TPA: hypothetical protein [Bacteriophage sp.]